MSTWMVVEDEPDIYEVLLTMFEMWGIDGAAFVEGEEAITWIEEVDSGRYPGELPELALVDIRLPGKISGIDVAIRLRKSPKLGQIPIVFSTAYHLSPDEEQDVMNKTDADKILYKPLPRFHDLQRILDDIIAQRRTRLAAPSAVRTDIPPTIAANLGAATAKPSNPVTTSAAKLPPKSAPGTPKTGE